MRNYYRFTIAAIFSIFLSGLGYAPEAHASTGWCTTVSSGGSECFTTPRQACARQHASYAPSTTFYGYADDPERWYSKYCKWQIVSGVPQPATIGFRCDFGYEGQPPGLCVPTNRRYPTNNAQKCDKSCPNPQTPHPVQILTGSKSFQATDFANAGRSLWLRRYYTSRAFGGQVWSLGAPPLGLANWYFDFNFELQIKWDFAYSKIVTLLTPQGGAYAFQRQSSGDMQAYTWWFPQNDYTLAFSGTWPSDLGTLTNSQTTWILRDSDDNVWTLKTMLDPSSGKYQNAVPTSLVTRDGLQWTFAYTTDYDLATITDSYGKVMTFHWVYDDPSTVGGTGTVTARAISQVDLPNGDTIQYTYDTVGDSSPTLPQPDRLIKVEYVDSTSTVRDRTTYDYGNTSFPYFITGVRDKDGTLRWSVTYNSDGQATVSQGPSGANAYSVAYAGTDSSFTRTVTNPLGKEDVYNFTNAYGWDKPTLTGTSGTASTHVPSSSTSLSYGSDHLVSSSTDEEGRVTNYTRNSRGLPTQIVEAYGTGSARTTSVTWHSTFSLPTQIVQPGLTTDYTYDSQGRLTALTQTDTTSTSTPYSTNGQTRTWAYSWSSSGQLQSVDGPLSGTGDTISYGYNSNGYLTSVTNELGQTTTVNTLNGRGQPTEITDPNSVVTDIAYDVLGRTTSITVNPGSSQAETSFEYNVMGDVTKITLPNGTYLQYAYDDARRVTSITNNSGEKIEYTYNANSDVTATNVKTSGGTIVATHSRVFDELGRVLQDIGASSQTTAYAYDKVNNRTSITDPRSKVYAHAFDGLNRLTQETDPNSYHTNVAYNGKDEVTSVTDARSLATTYVRNGFGDVIRQTSPDTGVTDFWYDAAGRMTKRVDARSVETDFTYDAAGRPLTKTFPASTGENVTYSYDSTTSGNKGVGRLTGVDDTPGSIAYTYNALGQITRERHIILGNTYDTYFAYDAAGNATQITYPSGRIVNYTRNSLGRITAVTTQLNSGSSADGVASSVTYRPFGPLSGLTFANGVVLAIGRDSDGQIASIDAATASATIQDLSYAYDDAGNITSITDNYQSARNQTFGYDNLNRLASASGAYGSLSFTYDGAGNRATRVAGSVTDTYSYSSSANRLSTVSHSGNTRSFSYAASGQVSQDVRDASNTYAFNYNDNGRMSSASLNSSQVGTYVYNGLEQRVAKTADGVTTHYIFDRFGHLLAEHDASGTIEKEYIWLDDLPIAVVDSTGASPVTYYIHADHLGRPQKLTNASAAIVWDGIFQPFGEAYSASGSATNFLMFPGQFYDYETQLSQNWHRDYDPTIGRYIQSDPIGLMGGVNTYGYVGGNPLTRIDPTGESEALALCAAGPAGCAAGIALTGATIWMMSPAGQEATSKMSKAVSEFLRDCLDKDCEKVRKRCYDICLDTYVHNPDNLPGVGHDYKGRFRRCVRQCMDAEGCGDQY